MADDPEEKYRKFPFNLPSLFPFSSDKIERAIDEQTQAELQQMRTAFDSSIDEDMQIEWDSFAESTKAGFPGVDLDAARSDSKACVEVEKSRDTLVTQFVKDGETEGEFADKPLFDAVNGVLAEAGIAKSEISIALVDDARIHELNRQFLGHDYPTDVITFPLGEDNGSFQGEIVISVDTAKATAARLGWPAEHELLLYVIHGALHLVGYDNQDPDSVAAMRAAERRHLARFGLTPPEDSQGD